MCGASVVLHFDAPVKHHFFIASTLLPSSAAQYRPQAPPPMPTGRRSMMSLFALLRNKAHWHVRPAVLRGSRCRLQHNPNCQQPNPTHYSQPCSSKRSSASKKVPQTQHIEQIGLSLVIHFKCVQEFYTT